MEMPEKELNGHKLNYQKWAAIGSPGEKSLFALILVYQSV